MKDAISYQKIKEEDGGEEIVVIQRLPLGTINVETGEITIVNEVVFSCQNSTLCCKENRIPVSEKDIERITAHGYDLFQFLDSFSPVLLPSKTGEGRTKVYILKKKPFTNECVFLDGDKCAIHEFKPLACRLYPFAFNVVDDKTLQVTVHPESVCPSVQVKKGEGASKVIIQSVFETVKKELDDFTHSELFSV